jgi:hypothetical protein
MMIITYVDKNGLHSNDILGVLATNSHLLPPPIYYRKRKHNVYTFVIVVNVIHNKQMNPCT